MTKQTAQENTPGSGPELLGFKPAELHEIYRGILPGPIPRGDSRGTAIILPGTLLARPLWALARVLWQGKVFDPRDSTLKNKILGFKALLAKVYSGQSWLDGKPSTIIDYSETSRLVGFIRDEIREVQPGLYLGLAYLRTKPQPKLAVYFTLDFRP